MKFSKVTNNFSAGQWSPRMLHNNELEEYQRACISLQNMLVLKEGGAFARAGFKYIDTGAFQAGMNASASYLRMFPIIGKNSGVRTLYILVTTNNAPNTDWFIHNVSTGVNYAVSPNASATSNVAYDLDEASYSQVGDQLFVANKAGSMPFVTAVIDNVCYIQGIVEINLSNQFFNVPYRNPNVLGYGNPQTITSSAATGVVTLTASAAFFVTSMANTTYIKLTSAGSTGVALITAVGGAGVPQLTCTALVIYPNLPTVACGTAAGTAWEISAWNGYYGWPTKVTSFEQRLYWGGKSATYSAGIDSHYVWGSRAGDPIDMMEIPFAQDPDFTTYADDNSRPFTLVPAGGAGELKMLAATKVLTIGFSEREMVARGTTGMLGPNDISIDSSSSFGASGVHPVSIDNNTLYAQAGKRTLRQMIYSYENEQYKSVDVGFITDVSTNSDYIVKKIAKCDIGGTSVLFVLTHQTNGITSKLLAVSMDEQNRVVAWCRVEPGGTDSPFVRDIVNIPGVSDNKSVLYAIIVRDGTTAHLQKLTDIYERTTYSYSSMYYYMDSWIQVSSPASTTISVPHLANKLIHYFCDGAYKGTATVSGGGTFEVDVSTYREVVCGIVYSKSLIPVPIRHVNQAGNSTGKNTKVSDLFIHFFNTLYAKYGDPERGEHYEIEFRKTTVHGEDNIPLYTGSKLVKFPPGHSRDKQVEIRSDFPFPVNVLSISAEGVTYD